MTRRTAVFLLTPLPGVQAAEPWKVKDAAEWSSADRQKLRTNSPWAKEAVVGGATRTVRRKAAAPPPKSDPRKSATAPPPITSNNPTEHLVVVRATVRWASAQPFFDAIKKEKTKMAKESYILSLTGWPAYGPNSAGLPQGSMAAMLKDGAALERKGRDPITPSVVEEAQSLDGELFLFLFPKVAQPIEAPDKEVTFHVKAAGMEVRAKFVLKDMEYEGKLEL